MQPGEDVEEGDDEDGEGDEDGGQHEIEDLVAAGPLDAREAVGDDRVGDDGADDGQHRDDGRVAEVAPEGKVLDGIAEIGPRQLAGQRRAG